MITITATIAFHLHLLSLGQSASQCIDLSVESILRPFKGFLKIFRARR